VPIRRQRTLLCALVLGALAGTTHGTDTDPGWRDAAYKACAPRDGARCDDDAFLADNYDPQVLATREVARRAAVRSNRDEQRATRELLLQYSGLCETRTTSYCAANPGACSMQLAQMCQGLKRRAAYCKTQTQQYCASQRNSAGCNSALQKQCPSGKAEDIDKLLARYDDLSPTQKARLKQLAKQLKENKDETLLGGLINNLMGLLGFSA
jgi:hypothetical protein